ncbi:hypothetical protein P3875_04580 [Myroides sp. JBRI-B21084]|uniref:hypothetical protein n=1 Tax=Myroides sp. JBRI-B21084 TaxID=3119977 RepID=UPI0026E48848|nr:hypothetical protein [Paenimyroides cloacae]WKW47345.1 hypothetical protein P3875_04580 [Paenimyroides cloacae]
MKRYIKKLNFLLILLFFISCTKRIDLTNISNNKVVKIEQSKENIKIIFKDSILREIELYRNQRDEYVLDINTNILNTQKALNLKDSIFLTKTEFYKKYNIYDKEMNLNIFVNNFNYRIDDNLYVMQISFSPIPIYCIKIYFDSSFTIRKIFYQNGKEMIVGKHKKFKIRNIKKYGDFLNKVRTDSITELKKNLYLDNTQLRKVSRL